MVKTVVLLSILVIITGCTTSDVGTLNSDELMSLAIVDARNGHHDRAIRKLKKVLDSEPANANAVFLLAAEHAEIGLYDRAIKGYRKALTLNADLHVARLQLGLVLYFSYQIEEAREVWRPLSRLDENNAIRLFPEALLSLADGNKQRAITKLEAAIAKGHSNRSLIKDMQRVLAKLRVQSDISERAF